MAQILEAVMVICFGISWPLSIRKSFLARTNKGKSLLFLIFITTGYVCGIASKIIGDNITYVFFFYVLNLCMLIIELILYARNGILDKLNEKKSA